MDVKKAIEKRRAYRSLSKTEITEELVNDLAECIRLTPSCFNNQPWKYVFVYDKDKLEEMHSAFLKGNEWAKSGSMIIAVFSKKDDDCVIKDRRYYLFDTGIATGFLLLRIEELGLNSHPIAGFSPSKTRKILNIPDEMKVIALIIVGKKSDEINPELSEDNKKVERARPKRLDINKFAFHNTYKPES